MDGPPRRAGPRLAAHRRPDQGRPPPFLPDGRLIAYTSWRSLVPEIHLVPVDGGPSRRLTYWGSADTQVCGWSPPEKDGHSDILAVASHGQPFSVLHLGLQGPHRRRPRRRAPRARFPPSRSPTSTAKTRRSCSPAPRRTNPPPGSATRAAPPAGSGCTDGDCSPTPHGHLDSPMFVGGRIAFLSDHEGIGNLYSCATTAGTCAATPTTTPSTPGTPPATAPASSTSAPGTCGSSTTCPRTRSRAASTSASAVRGRGRRTYQVPAAQHVDGISVDETGRASAVVVRGSLHWLTHRDGPARTIADTPGVRVRLPEMLGSGGRIAYVTDADGEDAVEIAFLPGPPASASCAASPPASWGAYWRWSRPAGRTPRDRLERRTPADPRRDGGVRRGHVHVPDGAGALPDRTRQHHLGAGARGHLTDRVRGDLADGGRGSRRDRARRHLADRGQGGEVTELITSINGPVRDLAFSPDGAWLTWSHRGLAAPCARSRSCVGHRLIVDVTNGRFEDENPVFTRDGRYLAFLSWRGFDPVYDVHTGDLSFPLGCRPDLVPRPPPPPPPSRSTPTGGRSPEAWTRSRTRARTAR